ncbi:unnamed protein product [Cylicostephanus goldi]|uniref:PH-like domain-containing protein n=1 Tax=Cylicostephanus goldi TaxID=71465 RepID=A0A3P7M7Q9_CYLGO|nr:unnamed protein product [Cylicostephanus goldi]
MPYHFNPTVIIHSMSCFSTDVIPAHLNIPIAAIYFGNIQGGVLISHWEVSYRDKAEADERWKSKISADFMYDQTDIISLKFENPGESSQVELHPPHNCG